MFEYIENMRKQSPAVRKLFAFGVSLFVVGVIFVFWITVRIPDVVDTSKKAKASNFATPEKAITENMKAVFSGLGDIIGTLPSLYSQISATTTPATSTEDTFSEGVLVPPETTLDASAE